ncbi:hypothetical protein WJX73_007278, partial [Symbiochloris irregularis]
GCLHIAATSGTELAAGLHYWLKERCSSSVSWHLTGGNQIDPACFSAASLAQREDHQALYRGRSTPYFYYQNVVTVSYSSTWWDWERWEQEIDWMALHGINLPLAFTGQEEIWRRVWRRWNLTEAEIAEHFSGPSFLAWQRMGNLRGWGGPLSDHWMLAQADLQKRILRRMRALDMTPVLPAFAGIVPRALGRVLPKANITRLSNWCNFPDSFCCASLLSPLDPAFLEIGTAFVQELRKEYGWDASGWYSADTFNEMTPPSNDPAYLASISAAVFQGMAKADPTARWLMQAWLFYDESDFWQGPQVQGLISGVPKGRLVLLDLYAELYPQWQRFEGFYGTPWIWCMLHNFGGNTGMYGALQAVASKPADALAASNGLGSSLVGFGMCPEGIEQNPVVYDAMSQWAFRSQPFDIHQWIGQRTRQRYGASTPVQAVQAWQLLADSVYAATDGHIDHVRDIPQSRPGLAYPEGGLYSLKPALWYNPAQVLEAWRLLLTCAPQLHKQETFLYDLVDVTRQALSKHATTMWQNVVRAYRADDSAALVEQGQLLLDLLGDLEVLLSSNRGFMLGSWVKAAEEWATTPLEAAQYRVRWAKWLGLLAEDLQLLRPYNVTTWRMLLAKDRVIAFLDRPDLHTREEPTDQLEAAVRSCQILIIFITEEWMRADWTSDALHWALEQLGIVGPGGIGKTTLACELFDELCAKYGAQKGRAVFLHVGEAARQNNGRLLEKQQELIGKLFPDALPGGAAAPLKSSRRT